MRSARVSSKRVVTRTAAQLEGFKKRPELEKGMPCTIAEIVAMCTCLTLSTAERPLNS